MSTFTKVSNKIFNIEGVTSSDILVFSVLSKFKNNKTNTCFPSIRKISSISKLCKQTVITSIKRLEEFGAISVERRTKKNTMSNDTNLYTILFSSTSEKKSKAQKKDNGNYDNSNKGEDVDLLSVLRKAMKSCHVSKAVSNDGGSLKLNIDVLIPLANRVGANNVRVAMNEIAQTNKPINSFKAVLLSKFN